MVRAILFDLDETLVEEEPSAAAAFAATALIAARCADLDPRRLAADARVHARALWQAGPQYEHCRRIGMSSWEGLWCRFEGDTVALRALAAWAPSYRRESWRLALADQQVDDRELAQALGERFGVERRARHVAFADCAAALDALATRWPLALVTNGASCLQREKLRGAGLAERFSAVVASGDIAAGKPAPEVFTHALALLGVAAHEAVMIGDNRVNDVEGARRAGIRALWLDRDGEGAPAPDRIESLAALPAALDGAA